MLLHLPLIILPSSCSRSRSSCSSFPCSSPSSSFTPIARHLPTFDMPTAGGAGVDTLRPQHVWSPKRLIWPTATRAHALRRMGAAGGATPRPLRAAAGRRRHRRRPLGALCWRRAPAPVTCTVIRRPSVRTGRTAGRQVVVLVCGSTTLPMSLSTATAVASSVSYVAPAGTARPRCSSSCSYTPRAHHHCSVATYAVILK